MPFQPLTGLIDRSPEKNYLLPQFSVIFPQNELLFIYKRLCGGGGRKQVPQKSADYAVQSLEKALALLDMLSTHADGLGVTELGQKLGMHKSTLFRKIKRFRIDLPRTDGRTQQG